MKAVIFAGKHKDQQLNLASARSLDAIVRASLIGDGVLPVTHPATYLEPILHPKDASVAYPVNEFAALPVSRQGFRVVEMGDAFPTPPAPPPGDVPPVLGTDAPPAADA